MPLPQKCDIVLSIKPCYAEKIIAGDKTVELRRRITSADIRGATAYIYASNPVKAMVGAASIRDVLRLPVEQIWNDLGKYACIERQAFDKYFEGLEYGNAIVFDHIKSFVRPLPLNDLRAKYGFIAPQSFSYAKQDMIKAFHTLSMTN